ncbi:MAG: TPM domain-containing protein [Pseudomonadales bacterium]
MQHLNEQDKRELCEQIRNIEASCNAELVTVISQQSDEYYYIPVLWAALTALLLPGLVSLLELPLNVGDTYLLQIAVFAVFALLLSWPPVKFRVVPKNVQYRRASLHAHELFFIEGLHITENRSGVMIFVSLAERYVEIIADHGIAEKIDQSVWQEIVDDFIVEVSRGKTAEGYQHAVERCGALLQEHFPGGSSTANELPDHLIEL